MSLQIRIPVTVITGSLGAGKTTVLNRLLAHNRQKPQPKKLVIVENEFAMEYGVEQQLLLPSDGGSAVPEDVLEIFEFGTGCLCCSSFAQFIATMQRLARSSTAAEVHHVLVETTGLAGGGPDGRGWAPLFELSPLADHFRLVDVIAIVDAVNFIASLKDPDRPTDARNETAEQVSIASVVFVSKTDLLPKDSATTRLDDLEALLRSLNPYLLRVMRGIDGASELDCLLRSESDSAIPTPTPVPTTAHDAAIKAHCIVVDASFERAAVLDWLQNTLTTTPGIMRLKAVLPVMSDPLRLLAQGVGGRLDVVSGLPWAPEEERVAKVVLIGRNLNFAALEEAFRSLPSAGH
jgi:G3E family GTPase